MVIIEPCRACAANHGGKLSVFVPFVAVCGTSVGFACPKTIGVVGIRPGFAAFSRRLHLTTFPSEGIRCAIVIGQRIADGIVGDGLAVIRGQTVLPAIGGVAVGMGALLSHQPQ